MLTLSFVFLNQGDMPKPRGLVSPGIIKEMAEQIEASGMRVHDVLLPILGKPKRDTLGKGDLREKVWRWDWNGHALMLTMQDGKYAALRRVASKDDIRSNIHAGGTAEAVEIGETELEVAELIRPKLVADGMFLPSGTFRAVAG